MDFPGLDNQQFSEKTLKGFLLKNVDPNAKSPAVRQLNNFLVKRVDTFWDQVIIPIRNNGTFDGNKTHFGERTR